MIRPFRHTFLFAVIAVTLAIPAHAAPFSMFPKTERLISPDHRFEVRDVTPQSSVGELVGAPHSLWLTELSTGRSRKLCDYLGLAAVAWSSNDFLVITQYLGRKTSRALVFAVASSDEPVLLDAPGLIQMLPVELRPTLRENDHLFVEASRLEQETFFFRVWGYGKHDPNGFRWNCQYLLSDGQVSCTPSN
jgi:hypothetical protein